MSETQEAPVSTQRAQMLAQLAHLEQMARYFDAAEAGQWSLERDERHANDRALADLRNQLRSL